VQNHVPVQTESMLLKVQVYITEHTSGPSRRAADGPSTSSSSQQQQQQQQQSWGGTPGEGLRHRHPAPSSSGRPSENGDAAASGPEVPLEQRVLVNTILKSKDFYEILSVSRTASDDDIKKSYRKVGTLCFAWRLCHLCHHVCCCCLYGPGQHGPAPWHKLHSLQHLCCLP
jgi:hypothetical protein